MGFDWSQHNTFVDNDFERLAEKREDSTWLEQALRDQSTRFIGVWQNRCPVNDNCLQFASASVFDSTLMKTVVLLGQANHTIYFALDLGTQDNLPKAQHDWAFKNLRTIGSSLDAQASALGAYAQAMVFWHRRHQYCGECGSDTTSEVAGHARDCTNSHCRLRTFPRIDPAVIVAPYHQDKILLGRQADWPKGRFSTIAGFVEPGESLEMTVRREVLEETGHAVNDVHYYSSQPWPFPSSHMIGFLAEIEPQPSATTDGELEQVQWFDREQIIRLETQGSKFLPPSISISYRLVEHWFNLDREQSLSQRLCRKS